MYVYFGGVQTDVHFETDLVLATGDDAGDARVEFYFQGEFLADQEFFIPAYTRVKVDVPDGSKTVVVRSDVQLDTTVFIRDGLSIISSKPLTEKWSLEPASLEFDS